jgi:phosphopantothenoylcysteine decarboxylase/phosphopantothenate--cysteine ligase
MSDIVLGVSGSIAAYKACDLASKLVKAGIGVHVVMTESAVRLMGPVTFQTLTGNPVVTGMFHDFVRDPMPHISLADSCAAFVVAPATANIIGKFACGIADDALTTLALSFDGPRLIAPAMNDRMWKQQVVRENVERLRRFGWIFIDPGQGHLACGATGTGRMAEPDEILNTVLESLEG